MSPRGLTHLSIEVVAQISTGNLSQEVMRKNLAQIRNQELIRSVTAKGLRVI